MSLLMRVRVSSTGWTGGPGLNTFYFERTATPDEATSSDAQACADAVHAAFASITGIYPTQTTLTVDPVVDVLTAATGELVDSFSTTPSAALVGGATTGYLPIAAMICLGLITNTVVNGHRVRGRAFLGPLGRSIDTNGTPDSGAVGDVQDIVAPMIAFNSPTLGLVVWHRPVSGAGGAAAPVVSGFVRDTFAVLRSRRD